MTLTQEDIVKLAAVSKRFRNILSGSEKVAEKSSEFNETVPAVKENGKENGKEKEKGVQNGSQKPPAQEQQVPVEGEIVATPEASMEAQTGGPEEIGARAAQSFIGPEVMQAAMSGDMYAQELIARVAGQIAGSVTESVARQAASAAPAQAVPAEGDIMGDPNASAGAMGVPAVSSPEENLANEIVPPAPAAPAAPVAPAAPAQVGVQDPGKAPQTQVMNGPNQGPAPAPIPNGGNGAMPAPDPDGKYDEATVAKLIALARAGKI